jgi:hypothetical protein
MRVSALTNSIPPSIVTGPLSRLGVIRRAKLTWRCGAPPMHHSTGAPGQFGSSTAAPTGAYFGGSDGRETWPSFNSHPRRQRRSMSLGSSRRAPMSAASASPTLRSKRPVPGRSGPATWFGSACSNPRTSCCDACRRNSTCIRSRSRTPARRTSIPNSSNTAKRYSLWRAPPSWWTTHRFRRNPSVRRPRLCGVGAAWRLDVL